MLLTRGGDKGQASLDRETNSSLVSALAKAFRWQEQLESGEYASATYFAGSGIRKAIRKHFLEIPCRLGWSIEGTTFSMRCSGFSALTVPGSSKIVHFPDFRVAL